MDRSVIRVLLYVTLGVILYGSAMLFVESQAVRAVFIAAGVSIIVGAELLFWIHLVRLSLRRRRQ
jgi:hypothetical protein